MSDFPTKAHGKRKAGGENSATHLKPSNISKRTKIDSSENTFSTEEDVSPVNSEKTIIDLTAEHSASPFTSSLVLELVFEEFDEETHDDFDEYREYDYDLDDKFKYGSGDDDDDDDYSSKKIETKVCILKGMTAQCMLSIYVTKDEQDNKWLDNIRVECLYKGNWVGRAVGSYIHRQGIKSNFLSMMELPNYKMDEIAGELFEKFGCLHLKFKEHVIKRGTGAWGAEMDVGPLFRRKGLGRAMVKALIQKSQAQAHPFRRLHAITKPDWTLDHLHKEAFGKSSRQQRAIKRQPLDSAIAFYRSLGFRCIGSSDCFGFSVDPKHKAHSINVDADYDPPRVDEELEISDDEDIVDTSSLDSLDKAAQKRSAKLKQRFPLRHAIRTLPDAELVAFFKSFDNKNGSGWKEINCHHNNALHQAGCAYKVYATKWLIKNIDPKQELAQARNIEGLTPLEALQDEFDIFDKRVGIPFGAVACMSLLKYRYLPSSPLNTQALRLKYGCTCEECIEGFVSPRMKLKLLHCAVTITQSISYDPSFFGRYLCNPSFSISVPKDLMKTFRQKNHQPRIIKLFGPIIKVLDSNCVPRVHNLKTLSATYKDVDDDDLKAALAMSIAYAKENFLENCDLSFLHDLVDEIGEAKECTNDYEFEFVHRQCCWNLSKKG
ncbi:uncharacterized protein EAF02_010224 [Botrytis sinoallii]|uniref:uncharacterized protein n=1 Tax=Botrytis sinoallii TaxID=1463999 RepID=UPI0019005CA8|nr:uncharacterized protein EAF02_010224 [Botrytis sinoallii]KAF7864256.1 hypothetical protein EAF02_010224 [Botrytis sinoallii]